jgi:O-antigen/teichoic acid export membrane protein
VSAFSRNLIANLAGTGWTSLVQLAVVPALAMLLGVEGYAVIGFYASLTAVLVVLDFGLSASLMRRTAGAGSRPAGELADGLWTNELLFCAMAVLVGGSIALAAPLIARDWLSASAAGAEAMQDSIRLMGLLFALRWPSAPYVATLQGAQRHVGLNALNALAVTASQAGGVAVLAALAPRLELFFAWQCACAAMHLVALRALARRALPAAPGRPRFAPDTLISGWRFASGFTGIALTSVILTQADKLILVKLVPLEQFGYYSIAVVVASALNLIMLPILNTVLPRLCEHASGSDEPALRDAFHASSALMHALLVPAGLFLMAFPHELLLLWTGDPAVAAGAAPLLALLAGGALMNGLMVVPFALQIARGQTRIGFTMNLALCLMMVPAVLILASRFGVAGGAAVSPLVNSLYLAVGLPITYRACLGRGDWPELYLDVLKRQGLAGLVLLSARLALPPEADAIASAAVLAAALAAALALSLAASPEARAALSAPFLRRRDA